MTTDEHARSLVARATRVLGCTLLVCGVLGCFGITSTRHGDRVDVSAYPSEIQSAYRVFALRCSRCHTLARPLNAHITEPQHWIRYVTRMRRTPASGINQQDAKLILKFLLFYAAKERSEVDADSSPSPSPSPNALDLGPGSISADGGTP